MLRKRGGGADCGRGRNRRFTWDGSRGRLKLRERGFKSLRERGTHIRGGGGRGLACGQEYGEQEKRTKKKGF